METLPEYLKSARESFSYDLHHVAKITNISPKFLECLEAGYYHRLPADVYVYGFLRKLAELYRTDSELLIFQYKKERGIHEQLNKKIPEYKSYTDSKFEITPKTITFSLLAAFVIFILGYLFYQVHAINLPPHISITDPKDGVRVTTSSVLVQGTTDIGASMVMNDQQIFVDSAGKFKTQVSISPGEKILTFIAKNNFGKETTKQILVVGDFQTEEQKQTANATLTLTVSVGPNSTWLTIVKDNDPAQDETFIAGSSKTYTAQNKIVLSTGDAGSTSIILNGKDLGKLGREGEILRDIPFTADSVNSKP
ncbi:MAG: family transcriptional regulator [Candidatus Doudnabacteria bacterium]|nr:family transcriptional regulator [Candidatus Doudnabacteria bacterium]